MACKCYHADKNFLGEIGVCWGTRECDACSCGGDESKCDFYEDKRKKAKPKTTNADRIRAMTDEEMAEWIASVAHGGDGSCAPGCHVCNGKTSCTEPWLEWLRQEAHDEP